MGSAASEPSRFSVPRPAGLAPLTINPPAASATSPLPLSGRAEPGKALTLFVVGRPLDLDPPLAAGPDGRWSHTLELTPGGHTLFVAYTDSPDRTSDPATLEVVATTPSEATTAAPAPGESNTDTTAADGETANEGDGQVYVVQDGDWLSKLAADFLGDAARYPEIRMATNAKAAAGEAFATIDDDNLISPGDCIWIPAP